MAAPGRIEGEAKGEAEGWPRALRCLACGTGFGARTILARCPCGLAAGWTIARRLPAASPPLPARPARAKRTRRARRPA